MVFLRDQDVTPTEMKDLMLRITELAGCVSAWARSPPASDLQEYIYHQIVPFHSMRTNTETSPHHLAFMYTP